MVDPSASFPTRELKEICFWVAFNYGLISYYASYFFFSGSCLIHCRSIKMNRNETNNLSRSLRVGLSPLVMFRSSPFVSKWSLVCRTASGKHQMFLVFFPPPPLVPPDAQNRACLWFPPVSGRLSDAVSPRYANSSGNGAGEPKVCSS